MKNSKARSQNLHSGSTYQIFLKHRTVSELTSEDLKVKSGIFLMIESLRAMYWKRWFMVVVPGPICAFYLCPMSKTTSFFRVFPLVSVNFPFNPHSFIWIVLGKEWGALL